MLNNRGCGRELGQIEATGSQLIVVAGGAIVCQQGLDVSFERRRFRYLGAWHFAGRLGWPGRVCRIEYAACKHGRDKTWKFNASTLSTNYYDNSYTTKCVEVLLENTPQLGSGCSVWKTNAPLSPCAAHKGEWPNAEGVLKEAPGDIESNR